MKRRAFWTAALGSAVALAGCTDGSDTPTTERTDPSANVTVSDDPPRPDVAWSGLDPRGLYLASADAAAQYFDPETAFVAETDFAAGERLVYVRVFAPQTCYRLTFDRPPEVDEIMLTLFVATERTAPESQGCGDAMTPVSVLARLSVETGSLPDVARIQIADTDTDPLQIEAED